MSQNPTPTDTKGKITLTWGDTPPPRKPVSQAPAPSPAPAPAPAQARTAVRFDTPAPARTAAQATTYTPAPARTAAQAPVRAQAPAPAAAPAPAPEAAPEVSPEPKAEETPAPQAEEAPQPAEAPTKEETPAAPAKKGGWGSAFFDTLLVLILAGALGGGAWYMHQQLNQYRVPSPLELAQAEHLELCKEHEQLQDAAYKADEQLHMRQRITNLDLQLADTNRQIAELKQGIETERGRIFSLQREIRHEDKTSRGVAKSMLIGLPVGNASTVNGKVYPNAIIHRLEAGRITLRTPHGQVRFPLSQLDKENMPDMVRYAFGIDDLVDMSDFEAEPGAPAIKRKRQGKLISPRKPSTQVTEPSYEPAPGAPVLNAQTPPATITVDPGLTPEDDGSWQAPIAPLPIEE